MKLNIQPLRPNMLFTDKDGQLTKEAYDFLFAIFFRVGGSLSSLDAATLLGGSWSAPNTIGSATPNAATFTSLTASTGLMALNVKNSVAPDGSGFKHKRVAAFVAPSSNALVTVTWPTAFANANYTVTCSVFDPSASATVVHIESITAASVTVRINNTSATTFSGTLHIIAVHD